MNMNSHVLGEEHKKQMLGSKDLGTNVFRALMCNVGKP